MIEYRWLAVGILMMYVIVSEILVPPVIWPPSWIYGTHRCSMTSAVPLLKSVMGSCWNFLAMCSRTRDMPGGIFTPPPALPVNVAKKTVAGTRVNECRTLIGVWSVDAKPVHRSMLSWLRRFVFCRVVNRSRRGQRVILTLRTVSLF